MLSTDLDSSSTRTAGPTTHAFMLAAPGRSSGKTTVAVGLSRFLADRNHLVQPFKKGPDYIDPIWLTRAARRPCYNLDFYLQHIDDIQRTYQTHAADVTIVEGNQSLHDSMRGDGTDSNAALAYLLDLPVVLVVNCVGFSRGVAPIVQGLCDFDNTISIVGVILNRVRGRRHADSLTQAIDGHTNCRVLGVIGDAQSLGVDERELGLVTTKHRGLRSATAIGENEQFIAKAAKTVGESCDLDALLELTAVKHPTDALKLSASNTPPTPSLIPHGDDRMVIGVFRDDAFCFYYQDDLDQIRNQGATLSFIDSMTATELGAIDGLFIGGGFPERYADALQRNSQLRQDVKRQLDGGLPVYAECGGLMYLCTRLAINDQSYAMADVISAQVTFSEKPVGRGYAELRITKDHPWEFPLGQNAIPAHEFHYSTLTQLEPVPYAYSVGRGYGINGDFDGIVKHNIVASYAHQRHSTINPWVDRFINTVKTHKILTDATLNTVKGPFDSDSAS